MDIMLKWIAYVILSAAETWIGYRLFNTYLTRNSVRQRYYWQEFRKAGILPQKENRKAA